jgi:hypothetical protein
MDACEFIGSCDGGIDAFVKHPPPVEFAGNDAHAIRPLGMLDPDEMFGQSIVIRHEHVRASLAPCSRRVSASHPSLISGLAVACSCATSCE